MSAPASFTRARPVARHCAELVHRDRRVREARLAMLGSRVAACLEPRLARFFDAAALRVTCTASAGLPPADALGADGWPRFLAVFAHADSPCEIAASVDAGDARRLVARLFGGADHPDDEAEAGYGSDETSGERAGGHGDAHPPLSARLLARELHRMVGEALQEVAGDARAEPLACRPLSPGDPPPLAETRRCDVLDLAVSQARQPGWTIRLACAPAAWAGVAGDLRAAVGQRPGGCAASVGMDIPLELRAVFAEVALPLPRLASLGVGEVLPLRPHRDVSVRVGDLSIAAGVAGAMAGERSLQLAQVFSATTPTTQFQP